MEAAAVVVGPTVTSLALGVPGGPTGHEHPMTESDPTGYQDSPDTTDPATAAAGGGQEDPTLTTDDDAQSDDGVVRPGTEAD